MAWRCSRRRAAPRQHHRAALHERDWPAEECKERERAANIVRRGGVERQVPEQRRAHLPQVEQRVGVALEVPFGEREARELELEQPVVKD